MESGELESGKIEHFEDIEPWQKARKLTSDVDQISDVGKFTCNFGLRDQIRRAAISVMSNTTEGFERNSKKEFIHFLSMAKGSSGEIRAQLYIALAQKYISSDE